MIEKGLFIVVALALLAAAGCGETPAPPPAPAATQSPATPGPTATATAAPAPTTAQPVPVAAPAPTTTAAAAPAPTATPPAAAPMGPTVRVSPSGLGRIVTDGDGNTLYLFMRDEAGPSECNDLCTEIWPPMVDAVSAGEGLDASLLGTTTPQDGTEQVTYNGWRLYYFSSDNAPGDANGQGINDVWWAVSPTGVALTASATGPYEY